MHMRSEDTVCSLEDAILIVHVILDAGLHNGRVSGALVASALYILVKASAGL